MSNNIPPLHETKKSFHQWNDSGELDVFEAARYFSGANEVFIGTNKNTRNFSTTQKLGAGRMSLDLPNMNRGHSLPLQAMIMENPMMIKKEKKIKQPSSPGGKLAHFLNSLFNQTSSKKKKSKSTTTTKDEDESPSGWRRMRRSSISHFRSGNSNNSTTIDSKSLFSSSTSSGFRTPPPHHIAHTPTKTTSYKDFKIHPNHKPAGVITKIPIKENNNKIETFKIKSQFSEKEKSFGNGFLEKVRICDEKDEDHHNKYVSTEEIRDFKNFIDHEDDGVDSDSSSDLFELTNCDLGYYSSGLPVYETTHMDSIKRGAQVSS